MVFFHGLGGSHLYWGAVYEELAAGSFLVVPDLLGFGGSPRPAIDYTVGAHAEAPAAAVSDVGAKGPLLLVAHSTGSIASRPSPVSTPSESPAFSVSDRPGTA